jgi:hypothetical protein
VGVSQRGHCTCLPQTSNQPHSGPRLALPCRLCRAATGYGSACPDSHRSCGHGRNRCRFRGSLWGVGVQVGGCRGGCWSARRGGLSRARRGGLDRGTGGDRRGRRRPRNGRGTGGCRGGRGGPHGAGSNRGVSGCDGDQRWGLSTASCPRVRATGICLDVCRAGQHHRFVQSEAGELPLRFPLHPS